jgi:hypothetical protein
VNLGSVVNGDQWEYGHCISADGLELYYTYGGIWYPNAPGWNISVSNRPGGAGLDDIWVSRRATRNDPWGAPENLGRRASKDTEWTTPVNIEAPVNTEFAEEFPMISADGSMLYFNSDRPGGFGDGSLAGADRSDCWP